MGYKRKFYGSVLVLGSFTVLNVLVSFLLSIFTSRLLSPKEFGIVALVTVFSGFISFFKDSGITYSIIRKENTIQQLNEIHLYAIVVGFFLFFIVALLAYPIAIFYNDGELMFATIAIGLTLLLESLSIVPLAYLRKNLDFKAIGFIQFFSTVIGSLSVIGFAFFGFSFWSIIFGQWISAVVKFFHAGKSAPISFSFLNRKKLRFVFLEVRTLTLSISTTRLISYWSSNVDNLLVGKFLGPQALGIYSRAYQMLVMQLNMITGTFNSALLPNIIRVPHQQMIEEYNDMINIIILITCPVMILLVFFSEPFVGLLWGKNWTEVSRLLPYFGIMATLYLPVSTIGSMFVATNNEKHLFTFTLITSVLTALFIILGLYFSLELMLLFLVLGYISVIVPINLYYGLVHLKIFSRRQILMEWVPKIVICLILLFTVYMQYPFLKACMAFVFFIYLLYRTRAMIYSFLNKFLKTNNP
jgi:PST family polysaccharide transporter